MENQHIMIIIKPCSSISHTKNVHHVHAKKKNIKIRLTFNSRSLKQKDVVDE